MFQILVAIGKALTSAKGLAAIAVAGQGLSAYSSVQAGKAAEDAAEAQIEREKIKARQEELARREELNRVLASNIISIATSGVKAEPGTSTALTGKKASESIGTSEGRIRLGDSIRMRQLKADAKATSSTAKLQAASTLLKTATSADMKTLIG